MADLLEYVFQDLGPNTLRAYARAWDDFAVYLEVPSRIEALRRLLRAGPGEANALALGYLNDMRRRELGPSTAATRLGALKGILKRLRTMGVVPWRIEIPGPKTEPYLDTRGPGREAVVAAMGLLKDRGDARSRRDSAMLHLLYKLGLRRGEAASLDLEHLDLPRDTVWILGKGREEREPLTVPPGAKAALEAWLAARPPGGGALFVALDPVHFGARLSGEAIRRITHRLGLGRPHGIRHTAITRVLELTKDVRDGQEFSRHAGLGTLQKYDDNRRDRAGRAARLLDEDAGP
jgi:integrase/recombinase XerC